MKKVGFCIVFLSFYMLGVGQELTLLSDVTHCETKCIDVDCGSTYLYEVNTKANCDPSFSVKLDDSYVNFLETTGFKNVTNVQYSWWPQNLYRQQFNFPNQSESTKYYVKVDIEDGKIACYNTMPECTPKPPRIVADISSTIIHRIPNGESEKIKFTPRIAHSTIPCDINVTVDDETNFKVSNVGGVYEVTLIGNDESINYRTTLKISSSCDIPSISTTIEGIVCNCPHSYNVKRKSVGASEYSDFFIEKDNNCNVTIDLEEQKWCDIGEIVIPEDVEINCNDFIIKGDGYHNNDEQISIINKGTIICNNNFKIENLGYYAAGQYPYFKTECSSFIQAQNIYIGYTYAVQPFNGTWISEKIQIQNGQGQDIDFPLCSYVNTKEIEIDANVSNGIIIKGHVISEKISSTKDIYLKYNGTIEENAILTVGELEGKYNSLKIIAEQYTIVNLCSNPTIGDGVTIENKGEWNEHPKGADNLGYYNGLIIYNYGEDGWPNGKNPEEEWDINYPTTDGRFSSYKAKDVVRGYATYQDCIDENNLPELLGIDDDPFLPKDKEIRKLYNCNPCSKDFEDTKMEIREIHGKTFRLINGELIYCENDN